MRAQVRRAVAGSAAVVTLIGVVVSGPPAQAEPSPPPAAPSPRASEADRARESIDYLMTTFHVSEEQALQRLRLQSRAPQIVDAVRAAVGAELLDFRLDQKEGTLVLRTSEPAAATRALTAARADGAEVRVVRSKHTAAELEAARAAVAKRLAGRSGVTVWTDNATETVRVRYAGEDRAAVRRSAGAVANGDVAVAVEAPAAGPKGEQKICTLLNCLPPARGGMRMHIRRDDGTFGSCTAGFTVRGSNGWVYLLTAGHCATTPGANRQYAYHAGLPLVWEKAADGWDEHDPNAPPDSRYFINQPSGVFHDYALMPFQTDGINWSGYWLNARGPHNLVESECVLPNTGGCVGDGFAITGVPTWDQIVPNTVVCATGTGTGVIYPENIGYQYGTRCGSIKSKIMTDYRNESAGGHGLKVDICSRKGDSGGPLFTQYDNKAYGVLSGGPPGTGPCSAGSGEYSVYSTVAHDLDHLSSRTGLTFHVITTADG